MNGDFFADTIDEALFDSTVSAFNNAHYDITDKQRTKWRKNKNKNRRSLKSNHHKNSKTDSRFIPIRDEHKFDQQQTYHHNHKEQQLKQGDDDKEETESNILTENGYKSCLKSSLLNNNHNDNDAHMQSDKVLTFKQKAPEAPDGYISNLRTMKYSINCTSKKMKSSNVRHIPLTAERVLDAPDLMDDFYLNLLDWGVNNIIGIGLGSSLYLWDSANGQINLLKEYADDIFVCSVAYNHNAQYIAVGTSDNIMTLYDVKTKKTLRKLRGHSARIGSCSWNHSILSTGSADSTIRNNDVRQKNYLVSVFEGHEQEICGLKWNHNVNGKWLASGSNDNKCCVWELRRNQPMYEFTESLSAVKALAFCPWNNNLLATGGGSGDRKIRMYNVGIGGIINEIDSESQVCSLIWNPFEKELLSSHGFSKNQLSIWKYPSLQRTHDLTGHTSRVLHTTLSPNGQIVCSAAADETLRFWKVFDDTSKNKERSGRGHHGMNKGFMNKNNSLNLRIR